MLKYQDRDNISPVVVLQVKKLSVQNYRIHVNSCDIDVSKKIIMV